ncbi:MAG: acyltransferase [Sedimenticola sp.]
MNEKYYSLQILRAIAAWMVFYHHYMQIFYDFKYESIIGHFFRSYGSFGVDIFFVLSGFVMYFSAKQPGIDGLSFFIKRFFRVAPVYWFYTMLMVVSIAVFPIEFDYTSYDATTLLSSLVFFPIENPSGLGYMPLLTVGWTLNFEMMFYTILSLSIIFSMKYATLGCFSIILIFPLIWPSSFPFSQVLCSTLLYTFLAGFVVASIVSSKYLKNFLKYKVVLSFVSLVISLVCFKLFGVHILFKMISASFLVFSAVLLNSYLDTNNKIISYFVKLGDFSYSTYLVHVFVLGIGLHYFGNKLNSSQEIVLIIGLSIILYVTSKYSYLYLEQNKYILLVREYLLTPKRIVHK